MTKQTFDRHVIALYDQLRGIIEKRYGEAGIDALHNAFISLYQCKAYTRLDSSLPASKVLAWLIEACKLSVRGHRRTEALQRARYKLLSELEFMVLSRTAMESCYGSSVAMPWEEVDDRPLELIKDVQKAIGALSEYHQGLVIAHFFEGRTLREIAERTDETFYRVFTEVEIAKACLRESLIEYMPRKWKQIK
jgi:DNA-directed RNA polymerase specialized sigma24 family protein